jgi:hypothetical protein
MYTTYNRTTGELFDMTSHEAKQEDLAARAAAATAAVVVVAAAAFSVPELGVQTKKITAPYSIVCSDCVLVQQTVNTGEAKFRHSCNHS